MNFIRTSLAKRDGIYVSRPLLNGDAWAKWAEKFGVPNVLPPAEMHVTVVCSRKDVKTAPQTTPYQVFREQLQVVNLGLDAGVLAVAWCNDWALFDRFWQLREMGATSDWPEFRPHVTLSYDVKGFELPDAALAEMPPSLLFGPEVHAPFGKPTAEAEAKDNPGAADDDELVILEVAAAHVAAEALQKDLAAPELSLFDRQTLALIAKEAPVLKSSLQKLAKLFGAEDEPPPKQMGLIKIENGEDRMVYGFASVSVSKGQDVVDSHKHEITTKAIRKLVHGLMQGQRAGKLVHKGDKRTDIVEGIVFDADVWKALGDYFEAIGELTSEQAAVFKGMTFEGALVGFECDDAMWALAKSNDFELSIGVEEATLLELK